ncbi:MAG TPA: plasmid stabilization protein, partial [Lachnospiraceae bacterium]|nr:plasmid stabilization protein [Lachnospiraceae bacterium]
MTDVIFLPPAAKYLKKLKDKNLKQLYNDAIKEICKNPAIGEPKHGDLDGVLGYDIYYNRINYELAYTVEERINETTKKAETVVIIMAGTR